jgi:hypothetical protein
MKFTLILENPDGSITEEQLQSFALNTREPSVLPAELQGPLAGQQQLLQWAAWSEADTKKRKMHFVYNCQALPSEEDQKERVEQDENLKCRLTQLVLLRNDMFIKSMTLDFSSEDAAKEFIQNYGDQGFFRFFGKIVSIKNSINFLTCKKIKSIFMNHFNLDEKCVDNILNLFALAEWAQIHQDTQNTLDNFQDELKKFFSQNEKVGNINELAQSLIKAAELFDKQQKLRYGSQAIFGLGRIFLSFNLRDHAMTTFQKIPVLHSEEYKLAQELIADLYMTKNANPCSGDFAVSSVQSPGETPALDYINLEQAYIAAYAATQYERCAMIADFLCEFQIGKFRDTDFGSEREPESKENVENTLFQFGNPTNITYHKGFLKACQIIRDQQEEIKRLKKQSPCVLSAPSSSACSSNSADIGEEQKRPPVVMLSATPTSPSSKARQVAADAAQLAFQAQKKEEGLVALHMPSPSADKLH